MPETRTIRIADRDFTIEDRYTEGSVLTANEAAALNQTRAENIGNNQRKAIKDAIEAGAFTQEKFQELIATAANEYEFGVRRTGSARAPVDPLEKEALRLAIEAVKAGVRKAGMTNVPAADITAKAESLLTDETKGAKLRQTAKANLKALAAITGEGDESAAVVEGLESGAPRKRKAKAEAAEQPAA